MTIEKWQKSWPIPSENSLKDQSTQHRRLEKHPPNPQKATADKPPHGFLTLLSSDRRDLSIHTPTSRLCNSLFTETDYSTPCYLLTLTWACQIPNPVRVNTTAHLHFTMRHSIYETPFTASAAAVFSPATLLFTVHLGNTALLSCVFIVLNLLSCTCLTLLCSCTRLNVAMCTVMWSTMVLEKGHFVQCRRITMQGLGLGIGIRLGFRVRFKARVRG